MSQWCKHLNSFRHSLAHRISLYIPENVLRPEDEDSYQKLEAEKVELWKDRANCKLELDGDIQTWLKEMDEHRQTIHKIELEQSKLTSFSPLALHSLNEKDKHIIVFHAQVISNWNTVLDFICLFLDVVQSPLGKQLRDELIAKDIVTFESE